MQQHQTGQERKRGSPPEIPKGSRNKFLNGTGTVIGLCLFEIFSLNKVEIIQASIKVKKTIKINKLESDIKSQSKNYDELKKYPDLRRNFEKIASKILKS